MITLMINTALQCQSSIIQRNILMSSPVLKENLPLICQNIKPKVFENKGQNIIRKNRENLLNIDILLEQTPLSISKYSVGIKKESKWFHTHTIDIQAKQYTFDKLLPIEKRKGSQQNFKVSYLVPSQVYTILSPLFLNGLGEYLQTHPKYHQQKSRYFFQQQIFKESQILKKINGQRHQIYKMAEYSEKQEDFITFFLKKYKQDQNLNQFIQSLLKFNYFNISDIAKNAIIRNQTEKVKRGKYSSFYELYRCGSNELKDEIISKLIGSECQLGRYSQFLEMQNIQTPFCIKYSNQYIAILYTMRISEAYYSKKLKNKALVNDLRRNNYKEIVYIPTIYVLPKYKGMGHGKNILNILKRQGFVVVLCSSATRQMTGFEDHMGTGSFYRKCQFQEYYPVQASPNEEYDQGCLLQSDEHKMCDPLRCHYPLTAYQDESYYVYYPSNKSQS